MKVVIITTATDTASASATTSIEGVVPDSKIPETLTLTAGQDKTNKRKRLQKWTCFSCRRANSMDVARCHECFSERGSEPKWFSDLDPAEREHIITQTNNRLGDTHNTDNDDDDDDEGGGGCMPPPILGRALSAVVYSTSKGVNVDTLVDESVITMAELSKDLAMREDDTTTTTTATTADNSVVINDALAEKDSDQSTEGVPSMMRFVSTPVTQNEKLHARSCLSRDVIELEGMWFECICGIITEVKEESAHPEQAYSYSVNFQLE
jgi:hypothetical protein